jgi:CBS domain-containing protein
MKVKDIMTASVATVGPDTSLHDAAERMKSLDIGSLLVCDGEMLIGIITDRDIAIRGVAKGIGAVIGTVNDAMTRGVVTCSENQDVADAATLMQDHKIRRLVVLNDDKQIVGIVSLGDLAVDTNNDMLVGETLEQISRPTRLYESWRVKKHLGP